MRGIKICYLPKLQLTVVQDTAVRVTEQVSPTFRLSVIEPTAEAPAAARILVQVI